MAVHCRIHSRSRRRGRAGIAALDKAYAALRAKDYDSAIARFSEASALAPQRVDILKDLAYTYLKIGENELARDRFGEAMKLEP